MRRLTGFVVLSACAHVALLLPSTGIPPRLAGQRDTILSVSIAPPVAPAERPRSAARSVPRHADTARLGAAAKTPDAGVTAPPAADAGGAAVENAASNAHVRARVHSQLLADLARYFDYPLLARRRGWEGTVWLGFIVAADGELERIHVARSSGYDALDVSALGALHRVGRLRDASTWLDGRALEMQLPVIYRLRE